jgi:DNA polymerase
LKSLRVALLRELRIGPLWRLRDAGTGDAPKGEVDEGIGHSGADQTETDTVRAELPHSHLGAKPPPPVRLEPSPPRSHLESARTDDAAREAGIRSLDWDALEAEIRNCQACRLFEQRRQAVPGIGDRNASWMFVGEGPGSEEDRRGEPFVGPAGKLLDAMLSALELERGKDVYIANAVKCRPPMNRTPAADEAETCRPFLERQIALVRPQVLVALGRPAAQTLLGTEVRINAVRGKVFSHDGIPVVVTFHPAYLLRNPSAKGKAWEDLCLARRVAGKAQDN